MLVNTTSNPISAILTSLAAVGAINWGLVGAFNFNLVSYLFGEGTVITKGLYIVVGVCGLYSLSYLSRFLFAPAVH